MKAKEIILILIAVLLAGRLVWIFLSKPENQGEKTEPIELVTEDTKKDVKTLYDEIASKWAGNPSVSIRIEEIHQKSNQLQQALSRQKTQMVKLAGIDTTNNTLLRPEEKEVNGIYWLGTEEREESGMAYTLRDQLDNYINLINQGFKDLKQGDKIASLKPLTIPPNEDSSIPWARQMFADKTVAENIQAIEGIKYQVVEAERLFLLWVQENLPANAR